MASRKIVLIDDEEHIAEIAKTSLEAVAGWDVVTARGGNEGLKAASTQGPDAIILDVMMPDMDGPTTFARLKEDPATQQVPVLFMTAKARPEELRRLGELGVAGLIIKPFDPLSLADNVARTLGWTL